MICIGAKQPGGNAQPIPISARPIDMIGLLKRLKRAYTQFQQVSEYIYVNGLTLIDVELETGLDRPIFICRNLNGKLLYLFHDGCVKSVRKKNGHMEIEENHLWDGR